MFYSENLKDVLFADFKSANIDEIVVVSGYLGPMPIQTLKDECFDKKAVVVYGMFAKDGIQADLHKSLIKINDERVSIRYSKTAIHSKIYLGLYKSEIICAKIGSANFSNSGLCNDGREVLVDADDSVFPNIKAYYSKVLEQCISCKDSSITCKEKKIGSKMNDKDIDRRCLLSLLSNGNVPEKSGLNWGCGQGHVSEGDAYIRISCEDIEKYPDIFPPKKYLGASTENDVVEFIWDDGVVMSGLMEGTQEINNVIYPKQISSNPRKSILGKYLRNRLGVSYDKVITKADLDAYGRTNIEIEMISEGVYRLDFSKGSNS